MATQAESTELPPGSYDDRGPAFRAFLIALIVITIVATCLRFLSRNLSKPLLGNHRGLFWWDDWLALGAAIVAVALCSLTLRAVHLGGGKHIWVIPPGNLLELLKILFSIYFVYDIGIALAKASALTFLKRIFPPYVSPRWFNIAVWICHGLNVAWLFGIVFGTIFMCNPITKNWNPTEQGYCGPMSSLYLGSALPSVVIDLVILLLPVPMIWGLQASRERRVGITVVFIFGYLSVVVTIGRLAAALEGGEAVDADITYAGIPFFYWCLAEVPAMIVCISLPAMLPLVRRIGRNYYQPLVSNLSALFSSRPSMSQTYQSTEGSVDRSHPWRFHHTRLPSPEGKHSRVNKVENTELETVRHSGDSRNEMLKIAGSQGSYTADIGKVQMSTPGRNEAPTNAIWVARDVEVKHDNIRS
ncbi:hypothetical protein F4861DRAFT_535326 [Xylaria intraflava]|nr:hypothetical protein F4861DRAFT_535326 [Xylaria intraflava]